MAASKRWSVAVVVADSVFSLLALEDDLCGLGSVHVSESEEE